MQYISTRGKSPPVGFDQALLEGLAPDGGLYLPQHLPTLPDLSPGLSYTELATEVLAPLLSGSQLEDALPDLITQAYSVFPDPEVAPIRALTENRWMLELFGGPTFSFKDYALQLLARMFDRLLSLREERMLLLGATSGDTGSAAIEACRDRPALQIVILFPKGRVSDIQRRQMTTVASDNVFPVEVSGTFDDCQDLVKTMFADARLSAELNLGAVNSINWGRVAAQIVYYVWAGIKLADHTPLSVVVPTGNFGNVLAAQLAQRVGADFDRMVVANNRNHGLTQLISTGRLTLDTVHPTSAPAMDIQVPSNLERYLFELFGHDGNQVIEAISNLRAEGYLQLTSEQTNTLQDRFSAGWLDDDELRETMSQSYREMGRLLDPHTAIGWGVGSRRFTDEQPWLTVATAQPAKFPDAVKEATGQTPIAPPALAQVMDRPERMERIPSGSPEQLAELLRHISNH